jgi:ABC-type oligopeptide transport system substrate-binding subunit
VARLGWHAAAAGLSAALLLPLPALAADPAKVLRYAFPAARDRIRPREVSDIYSNTINEAIFDRLLTYDYLARPAKLVPLAAEALPEVAENGKVYTFRIRKGIYFTPDPAFKGAKRELVAQDFIYSFMRFVDPKIRSPYGFLVEGKIEGLDALAEQARKTGKFDYDAKVRGLEAVDRYTLRFRLTKNDYNFPYIATHLPSYAVAREVIEAYGDESIAHPVGSGPYMLKSWSRRAKIVLEANPDYRGFVWDFQPRQTQWDQGLVAAMRGKKMPQIGRVEVTIIEEDQSRWLAFNQKELDYLNLPAAFRPQVFDCGQVAEARVGAERRLGFRAIDPDITYSYFNFKDPLTGGFSPRETGAAARDDHGVQPRRRDPRDPQEPGGARRDADPRRHRRSRSGLPQHQSLQPGACEQASRLFQLQARQGRLPNAARRQAAHDQVRVGLCRLRPRVERVVEEIDGRDRHPMDFQVLTFSDRVKAAKACQLMAAGFAWSADYPDGDNFMQLLYGPNSGQSNNGCYESKAFDAFYEKSTQIPDSPSATGSFSR